MSLLTGSHTFLGGSGRVEYYGYVTRERSLLVLVDVLHFPPPSLAGLVLSGQLLTVELKFCTILPLIMMDAYPNHMHPGSPYAAVGGPHHCDGKPSPDIATCTGLGFPPIGVKAAGQAIQRGLLLGTQQTVH